MRVDVVKVIADSFALAGLPVMTVDELLKAIDGDREVWNLYANGFTQGLNQCERPASTLKCMQFKPQNIVELCAFVAAIRPGFRSMVQTFISRTPFQYGIPSLDELLRIDGMTGNSAVSSFLLFDEQILKLMIAGGIPADEAYATIKHIKKKHREQVLAEKEKFKKGFSDYLLEKENASTQLANNVAEKVWKIIEDSSSYLFCCAHAFAYACDSAYGAWLKAHYPYEFYVTMLKLYTEKGDKDKVAAIISEMKRYKGIALTLGQWGQDNRDWLVDQHNHAISQSLASVKFISRQAAEDLYRISNQETAWIGTEYTKTKEKNEDGTPIYTEEAFERPTESFVDVLRILQMNTCLDTRQIAVLIGIGYFRQFGQNQKLMNIYHEFFEGKNKLTKTIKSFNKRLTVLREYEKMQADEPLPIWEQLEIENEHIGLCVSSAPAAPRNMYFVQNVDSQYGVKAKLYSVQRGTTGTVKLRKKLFEDNMFSENQCIFVDQHTKEPRYVYKGKQRIAVPGETEIWVKAYHFPSRSQAALPA